ncbi:MAG TPA: hypothetical protein ENN79_12995, partial [Desulfobacteraceae bacterium]|nr:hypothetical protein [Desulfobacteraceae bacterium]
TWGNHRAIVEMAEKIVKREGFGEVLADGVSAAAKKIGKSAEQYAVHVGGQEPGMHDPKASFFGERMTMAMYHMDATPGRHTTGFGPSQFIEFASSAAGLCMHGSLAGNPDYFVTGFLKAVTGWDRTAEEIRECGERIAVLRHVFCLRESDNPLKRFVHPRVPGIPPHSEGPLAGVTRDYMEQAYWNLGALDWDRFSTKPSKERLQALGLEDVMEDLYPEEKQGTTLG